MSSIDEQIKSILDDTKKEIQRRMQEEGENASGRTSLSMRVQKDGTKISLIGGGDSSRWGGKTAPIETLQIGRPPGGDYKKLCPIIVRWTVDKNFSINASSPKEEDSIRWAISTVIAKKIVTQGTERHRRHVDIYTTPVSEAADKIRKIVSEDLQTFLREIVAGRTVTTNI